MQLTDEIKHELIKEHILYLEGKVKSAEQRLVRWANDNRSDWREWALSEIEFYKDLLSTFENKMD